MSNSNIAIIILNWNGWQDTCECLTSLMHSTYQRFQCVVVDNGSTDDSLGKIKSWASGELETDFGPFAHQSQQYSLTYAELTESDIRNRDKFDSSYSDKKLLLVKNGENLGFARGTNVGLQYTIKAGFEFSLLLNNDTTVDSECLANLVDNLKQHPERSAISPIIFYYDQPDTIWYFGGELTFTGRRKFFNVNETVDHIKNITERPISFISGCALFTKTEIYKKYGVLTEQFFFGQEDYDFSLRMKKNMVPLHAISNAKVYHKVSISNKKVFSENRLPYKFIGYLNRFIHKKIRMPNQMILWKLWRFTNLCYIFPKLILIEKYPAKKVAKFSRLLVEYSSNYNSVTRDTFFKAKELFN
ncbi:glycosyltransferase family 2 protein [candidate division KSB1 bacterium]|nr:glycosyltransferase family 2 protein [candidate division KSB1 bacterium]